MDENIISRANYFDGQFLRTQDFSDEQGYHIGMRRRLNIANHTWGIVRGLEVCWDTNDGQFVIRPGIAIDGYGRELILPQSYIIPISFFNDRGSDTLDVYLVYRLLESDPAPKGYAGCLPDDKLPSGSYYRTQEQATVRVELGEFDVLDRRAQPKDVPSEDLGFDASRTPPDDPIQDWPVFLGQLQRKLADTKQSYTYTANLSGRPYAGLVGANIYSPLQHARIQLGQTKDSDPLSFAIFLTDLAGNGEVLGGNAQPAEPQFEINKDNETTIQGNTTVNGEVQINGGAVEFKSGIESDTARPWQIYHVPKRSGSGVDDKNHPEEIRIELPEHTPNDTDYKQLVIGAWSTQKSQFVPCLTIRNDCTVTIAGTLKVDKITSVDGKTVKTFNKNLSAAAQQMAMGSLMSGISGGTALLEKVYQRLADSGAFQETVTQNLTALAGVAPQAATAEEVIRQEPETLANELIQLNQATPELSPLAEVIRQEPNALAEALIHLDEAKARKIRTALNKLLSPKKRNT